MQTLLAFMQPRQGAVDADIRDSRHLKVLVVTMLMTRLLMHNFTSIRQRCRTRHPDVIRATSLIKIQELHLGLLLLSHCGTQLIW